ncbi:MAG: catechol 2,3-dioxygenase, partial [gamma proteobacterium symbiont of Ctena orbiculata]
MAFKGVLRPGLIQIRVLEMAEALNHYQSILGLDVVSEESDGRVYLKGWDEFDHHSVVLRPAESAGLDFVAFKVDSADYLQEIEPKI